MYYVVCDGCGGHGCRKCDFHGTVGMPEQPNPAKVRRLMTKVFVLALWLAAVFVVAWEFFGWLARFK